MSEVVQRRKGGKGTFLLYLVMGIPICYVLLPTVIFLGFALLPSVVAIIIERGKGYYAGVCVGAMNAAGCAPYLASLWFEEHSVPNAFAMLSDVFALLVIFACAAFGWAIYAVTPSVVSTFMTMTAGRRITTLREQQRELVQKWGPDVESVYEEEQAEG